MYRKASLLTILVILALGVGAVSAQRAETHLRFAHLAVDVDAVDVFVDGDAVLKDFAFFAISDHLALDPGPHTIAITRPDGSPLRPLVEATRLQAAEGHNYIVALYGLLSSETLAAVLIDETAVYEEANLDATKEQAIVLNAVSGSPDLDVYIEQERQIEGLGFGEFQAMTFPLDLVTTSFVETGDFGQSLYEMSDSFGLPNNTSLIALIGDYETKRVGAFNTNYSPLNIVDYLAGYRDHAVVSFNTFLKALDDAGLTETLTGDGPFTVFVPSDEAFNAMPQGELDALLANPNQLANTLHYHIVPERVTVEDILAQADGGVTTLKALNGATLTIEQDSQGGLTINSTVHIFGSPLGTKNGLVYFVDGVLQPTVNPANSA